MKSKALKPILLAVTALVLVAATVMATVAYMTSSAAVSNVFTVGNVSMQMFESKVTSDGKYADGAGGGCVFYGDPFDPDPEAAR